VAENGRSDAPLASIVVAARLGEGDPTQCLKALAAHGRDDVEVVLAVDGPVPAGWSEGADIVVERTGALVPELWTAGIQAGGGQRVGLLSASVVPADDWTDYLAKLVPDGPAAYGGPIEPPDQPRSIADWVVLFCRYSNHLLPTAVPPPDVAADNASYDRASIESVADSWSDGFWEPFVHRALRAIGEQVVMGSEPVVRVAPGQSVRTLARQRLAHGRHHARRQSEGMTRGRTLLRVVAAPLVPIVLVLRSGRAVMKRRRLRLRFAQSAPLLWWVHSWWAVGEARGYLDRVAGRA
jgi:hypothetical protein